MNRMIVVIFSGQSEAYAGVRALRQLHEDGSLALYSLGVIAKSDQGVVTTLETDGPGSVGTGVGMAVGGLIGMLGGPVGLALGAVAGSLAGALRDYWVAGVSLDFVEDTEKLLTPGKVAVVAEVEEDWVIPLDSAMEAAGGTVFRRRRAEVEAAVLQHDVAAIRSEMAELQSELSQSAGVARTQLQAKADQAGSRLEAALGRARRSLAELQSEAESRLETLDKQWSDAQGTLQATLKERAHRVRLSYDDRSAKLSQAWGLTKAALGA